MASTAAAQVSGLQGYAAVRNLVQALPLSKSDCHLSANAITLASTRGRLELSFQDVATEAEDDKDAQESSLYKEDSFRMYCMKVASPSLTDLTVD